LIRIAGLLLGLAAAATTAAAVAVSAPAPPRVTTPADAPSQSIRIDVQGAVAHVTVTRALSCGTLRSEALPDPSGKTDIKDTVLDVALPERSALLDVDVDMDATKGARFQTAKLIDATQARDAYVESLRSMGLGARDLPFEDEVRYRIRFACRPGIDNKNHILRYSFSTLLEFSGDRVRLVFPAATELSPPPTRVEVRVRPAGGITEIWIGGSTHQVRAGSPTASETVSTRTRWLVSIGPVRGRAESGEVPRLVALASAATSNWGYLAYAIGLPPGVRQPLPQRVLFLVDRSRSVGPGGLEAERELARRFLEALPPSTRFDALFFDRRQQRLFPLARTATREAISALENEMVPARLANGTDLGAALHAAGELLRREASDFSPRCLLIVLSDGAVGRPAAGAALPKFVGPLPGVDLQVAAISVRPNDDPPVSLDERRVLRELAAGAPLGGVERSIRMGETAEAALAILETLRFGGDVYRVAIDSLDVSRHLPRGTSAGLVNTTQAQKQEEQQAEQMEVIAPGGGASGIVSMRQQATSAPKLSYQGLRRASELRPIKVDPRWLAALLPPGVEAGAEKSRLLVGPAVAALVEPVIRPPTTVTTSTNAAGPRGYLERSVVRDALSIAYTPRARGCYLNRTAKTAAERDLSGRVRLALDLVRGEVANARVEASTLAHSGIESCLREAAYALEVPRANRNDDPVTAVLNLVFRPRTPERSARMENPRLDSELETIVEAALKEYALPDAKPPTTPDAGAPPER
jgi:hypothetical protein